MKHKRLKIGVIGLGMMGRMHLSAWAATRGAVLAMTSDADPRRAAGDFSGGWSNIEGGARTLDFSKIRGVTDPMELIHDPSVDVVDICVPTPAHLELALAAIRAGKHVICEKPLARSAADARRIAAAAEKGAGFFMPAMCIRFWPQWAWLERVVREETYGKVISASFTRIGAMPPGWFRDGTLSGGAILDLHLHDTDFVHHVFGPPDGVNSGGWVGPSGCVDHVHTRYLYQDGPVVTAEGSWGAAEKYPFEMSYRVLFERATADYRLGRADGELMLHDAKRSRVVRCAKGDGYQAELAYFVSCARAGKAPEVVTASQVAHSIRIVEAEAKSVLSGRTVKL